MNCTDFQAIVAGEREEDLGREEALAFERHLDSCEACGAAVARAEADLDRLAGALEPPALAASAWASVDAAVSAALRAPAAAPAPQSAPAPQATPAAAVAPRGEITPLPLPVSTAPVAAPVVAAAAVAASSPVRPAQPARPSALRGLLQRVGNGRSSGFSLVAAVLVAAFGLAVFSVSGKRERPSLAIGRVAPPEPDDVRIQKCEAGENYRQDGDGRTLAFIPVK